MAEDDVVETQGTQTQVTQTQASQIDWSQNTSSIPTIWGRLYSEKVSLGGKHCWTGSHGNTEYFDLINNEFSLGRSLNCTFVMRKNIVREDIINNISKQHFSITRDTSEHFNPAIITDMSYNGTFVNEKKIGKGNSRVLDDNDEISVTHPLVKIFIFKDLMKNDQDSSIPELILEKYYISRTLGQGACGIVKLVYDKVKCTKHAMKIVKKVKFTDGTVNTLCDPVKIKNEIDILKSIKHPLIVSTEEVYESYSAVYIVLELMEGGELFERISDQGKLSEAQSKFFFRQMVLAVMYLHSQGITHRDLKPENVLLESKDDETRVKLSDFGLSKFVGADSMKTTCGTILYVAPEVLLARGRRRYGPQVDVWSLGVILFVCLSGYLPFSQDYSDVCLERQIMSGRWRESAAHWAGVGARARDLVRRMLTVQPARRITPQEILLHPWLQDVDIVIRVERLLNPDLTITAMSDNPKNDVENRPVTKIRAKRPLSEDMTLDPQPAKKKVKTVFGANEMNDDTRSLNSVDGVDQ